MTAPLDLCAKAYTYTPTGCDPIDRFLAAIADASCRLHNTQDWDDPTFLEQPGDPTVKAIVQAAAESAARGVAELVANVRREVQRGEAQRWASLICSKHQTPSPECRICNPAHNANKDRDGWLNAGWVRGMHDAADAIQPTAHTMGLIGHPLPPGAAETIAKAIHEAADKAAPPFGKADEAVPA